VGILKLPFAPRVRIALVVELGPGAVRLPAHRRYRPPAALALAESEAPPIVKIAPFEASAVAKIRCATAACALGLYRDDINPFKGSILYMDCYVSAPNGNTHDWHRTGYPRPLAQEFISAMEHMVGPQTHLRAVCIGPEDDIERRQREIAGAVRSVDLGDGVGDRDRHVRRHAVQSFTDPS